LTLQTCEKTTFLCEKEVKPQAYIMEKNLVYTELLDIYKGLLTEKQAEAMEYYYDQDYSLSEISEIMDISRQGVRDFIKRGEAVMDEMEAKLNLVGLFRKVSEIERCASELKATNKRLSESKEIARLCDDILGKVKEIENGAR
jgi:predicted DNA-binding protein YlxM (UPF0122 family)